MHVSAFLNTGVMATHQSGCWHQVVGMGGTLQLQHTCLQGCLLKFTEVAYTNSACLTWFAGQHLHLPSSASWVAEALHLLEVCCPTSCSMRHCLVLCSNQVHLHETIGMQGMSAALGSVQTTHHKQLDRYVSVHLIILRCLGINVVAYIRMAVVNRIWPQPNIPILLYFKRR